jgi:hypothetical protein
VDAGQRVRRPFKASRGQPSTGREPHDRSRSTPASRQHRAKRPTRGMTALWIFRRWLIRFFRWRTRSPVLTTETASSGCWPNFARLPRITISTRWLAQMASSKRGTCRPAPWRARTSSGPDLVRRDCASNQAGFLSHHEVLGSAGDARAVGTGRGHWRGHGPPRTLRGHGWPGDSSARRPRESRRPRPGSRRSAAGDVRRSSLPLTASGKGAGAGGPGERHAGAAARQHHDVDRTGQVRGDGVGQGVEALRRGVAAGVGCGQRFEAAHGLRVVR